MNGECHMKFSTLAQEWRASHIEMRNCNKTCQDVELLCVYKSLHVSHIIHRCYFRCLSEIQWYEQEHQYNQIRFYSNRKRTHFHFSCCCFFFPILALSMSLSPALLISFSFVLFLLSFYFSHTSRCKIAYFSQQRKSNKKEIHGSYSYYVPLIAQLISSSNKFESFELLGNMFKSSELHINMF